MKSNRLLQKYNFIIAVYDDYRESDRQRIKRKIISKFYPNQNDNAYLTDSLFLYQIINNRIQQIGLKENISIYLVNYEEREGSLEIIFTLIIDTLVLYGSLRSVIDYAQKDLEGLLRTDGLYTRSEVFEIPDQTQKQQQFTTDLSLIKQRNQFIQISLIAIICILLSLGYVYVKFLSDNKTGNDQKLEITIKGLDSIAYNTNKFTLDSVKSVSKKKLSK